MFEQLYKQKKQPGQTDFKIINNKVIVEALVVCY